MLCQTELAVETTKVESLSGKNNTHWGIVQIKYLSSKKDKYISTVNQLCNWVIVVCI